MGLSALPSEQFTPVNYSCPNIDLISLLYRFIPINPERYPQKLWIKGRCREIELISVNNYYAELFLFQIE